MKEKRFDIGEYVIIRKFWGNDVLVLGKIIQIDKISAPPYKVEWVEITGDTRTNWFDFYELEKLEPYFIPRTIKFDRSVEFKLYDSTDLPERYIINEGATILFWKDGTKTIVKKSKDDKHDKEKAFLIAYFQKYSGMSRNKANKFLKNLKEEIKPEPKAIIKEKITMIDLSSKKILELREIAKQEGIKGYSMLNKADLIKVIKKTQSKKKEGKLSE